MRRLFIFFFLFAHQISQAQEATTTASGTGQAGNIILNWSVGEPALVNTVQSSNLILTQGMQKGRLTAFVVGGGIGNGELVVTPNPTPGRVAVKIGFLEPGQLSLRLFDADGLYMLEAVSSPASGSSARKRSYKLLRLP